MLATPPVTEVLPRLRSLATAAETTTNPHNAIIKEQFAECAIKRDI